jgi:hypothetical protein
LLAGDFKQHSVLNKISRQGIGRIGRCFQQCSDAKYKGIIKCPKHRILQADANPVLAAAKLPRQLLLTSHTQIWVCVYI